ncbi:flavin reductase family protein [Anaerobacillus alkaliphilus]|uniref:Flavin reductase family protein n=1 Tax=Anaerobacillus alkaliphilus TaxID=1548597 RepID=A0A4Q0VTK1_9BACI|nr:flavin reductase family protein [Anaerobacillus alkaliphilus]RXJ01920.1 flavin reductase family protein [Anaerobacillus alkaliphilus]
MLKSTNKTVLHCYPGLIALVTAEWDGTKNIMAAGWHSYISYDPPIYGVAIGEERFTHHLVKNSGEFAIQFVPAEFAEYIEGSGKNTGRDGNKFDLLNISHKQGETVNCPILTEAYVVYECKVRDVQRYGDHDWFVGDITMFHKDETCFENGLPNWDKLEIPLYLGQSQYVIANRETKKISIELKK